jgi:hypothetical protein
VLTRRVDLRFPIEIPGGTITAITARPVRAQADFNTMCSDRDGAWRVFSSCVRLPVEVLMELDQSDHYAVVDAIASLSGQAFEQARTERLATFAVIPGGKQ